MNIRKKPEWRRLLTDYIVSVQNTPFDHDKNHCVLFSANAVRAMTGSDPLHGFRSAKTERAMKDLMNAKGYKSHIDRVKELFEEVPITLAQPGDIGVMKNNGLGIVQGVYTYHPGEAGLVLTVTEDLKTVFHVKNPDE